MHATFFANKNINVRSFRVATLSRVKSDKHIRAHFKYYQIKIHVQTVAHYYRVLPITTECCPLLQSATDYYSAAHYHKVPLITTECHSLLQSAAHYYRVLPITTDCAAHYYRVLPITTECCPFLQSAAHY